MKRRTFLGRLCAAAIAAVSPALVGRGTPGEAQAAPIPEDVIPVSLDGPGGNIVFDLGSEDFTIEGWYRFKPDGPLETLTTVVRGGSREHYRGGLRISEAEYQKLIT